VVDDTLSNHDTEKARSSSHNDGLYLLGTNKTGLILGSSDILLMNNRKEPKFMECGGNKYMRINDLNHLMYKTSQLKQG
jgi:hypothetical protein